MNEDTTRDFTDHDLWALVAGDTFDPITERITKLLSHDRRMVLIRRYVGREDLTINPGLKLNSEHGQAIEVIAGSTDPRKVLWVNLGPGIHGFGFGTSADSVERQLRPRWEGRGKGVYDLPVTQVSITGRGTDPGRDDRIDIEFWNEHGVGQVTTVVFQCDWDY